MGRPACCREGSWGGMVGVTMLHGVMWVWCSMLHVVVGGMCCRVVAC